MEKKTTKSKSAALQLNRPMPQVIDLERAVLGALLIERDSLLVVIDFLQPKSFYTPGHQEIYRAIFELYSESHPVDPITVTRRLREQNKLEMGGGVVYVNGLTNEVNAATNIEYHARLVLQEAIRRDLIQLGGKTQANAFDQSQDIFEILDEFIHQGIQLLQTGSKSQVKSVGDIIQTLEPRYLELRQNPALAIQNQGVMTGFGAFDLLFKGFKKDRLTIIAGRPAMGKTSFALTVAANNALHFKKPVAFFSLEMGSEDLVSRLTASIARVIVSKVTRPDTATPEEDQRIRQTMAKIKQAPLFIDDTAGLTLVELKAKCRKLVSEQQVELIMIDYLQLMDGSPQKGQNREQEISKISRFLKKLTKELEVPIIALSQLSRAVELRGGDKRPLLSDLRESGSIEQDADGVVFLYRAEYYKITEDEAGNSTKGIAEVIVAKNRFGGLGTARLRFIKKYTLFENLPEEISEKSMNPHLSLLPKKINAPFDL